MRFLVFSQLSITQLSYTKGSMPPPDNKESTWLKETKKIPSPLSLKLMPIVNLLDDKSVFGLNVSNKVLKNLKKAYNDYCSRLQTESKVTSCEAPGPDPGFPATWQNWLTGITGVSEGKRLDPKICNWHAASINGFGMYIISSL